MKIKLSHGGGGTETARLVDEIFIKHFTNPYTRLNDAAVLPFDGKKLMFTTDGFVVEPLFFPGGDIGRLAVCGTVNDLLTTGGKPLYLSASFILEENADTGDLERIASSMRAAADEAGIYIVTGDTKVISGNGGVYVAAAGVGAAGGVDVAHISEGDAIIVSGTIGDHHACILSARMGITNNIKSDAAPLTDMVSALTERGLPVSGLRDITRGGLATVLNELAQAAGRMAEIDETALPVNGEVDGLCKILGLDPLYMGNEGKMLVAIPETYADEALRLIKHCKYGENAAVIGRFVKGGGVVMNTKLGGKRKIPALTGEGLPRIC